MNRRYFAFGVILLLGLSLFDPCYCQRRRGGRRGRRGHDDDHHHHHRGGGGGRRRGRDGGVLGTALGIAGAGLLASALTRGITRGGGYPMAVGYPPPVTYPYTGGGYSGGGYTGGGYSSYGGYASPYSGGYSTGYEQPYGTDSYYSGDTYSPYGTYYR